MTSTIPAHGSAAILARLASLAILRREFTDYKANLTARKQVFDVDNELLTTSLKETAAAIDQEEAAIRAMGLTIYKDTEDTKPAPGVEIKLFTTVAYDAGKSLALAKEKNIAVVVTLDEKAWKAIAPSLSDEDKVRINYTETKDVPKAMIATDIEKALEAVRASSRDEHPLPVSPAIAAMDRVPFEAGESAVFDAGFNAGLRKGSATPPAVE